MGIDINYQNQPMTAAGFHAGKSSVTDRACVSMSKLRTFETIGFRPENEAQEKLILEAQRAAGLTMAELLRRAVLLGIERVVADAKEKQDQAFIAFAHTLREQEPAKLDIPAINDEQQNAPKPERGPASYLRSKRKRRPGSSE